MKKTFSITIANGKPTCAELAGYELPELPRNQENDVDAMAISSSKLLYSEPLLHEEVIKRRKYINGFIDGYAKARERFEFSREDMVQAFAFGRTLEPFDTFDEFIQSIRNRTPIAIEVEMEIEVEPNTGVEMGEYPATNPDGTVKVVKWIFNE